MIMYRLIFLFIFSCEVNLSFAQNQLEQKIQSILKDKRATVGVCVLSEGKEMAIVNGQHCYPLLSVYKFPLALAVLNYLDKNHLPLDTKIAISQADLLPDTYSPIRDKYPQGNIELTVSELLKYTVALSDNNACDILFRYVGGPQKVSQYIKKLKIKDISIKHTEQEMHEKLEYIYQNCATPLAITQLLDLFQKKELLSPEYHNFLEQTMINTTTGLKKIRAMLPPSVIIGDKTGNSPRTASGMKIADNDLAFVRLPNGKQYMIAIFVNSSYESDETNTQIIAQISKTVYDDLFYQLQE